MRVYCPACGLEVYETERRCPDCGTALGSGSGESRAERRRGPTEREDAPIPLYEAEAIEERIRANRSTGRQAVGGHLYLTSERLVFDAHRLNVGSGHDLRLFYDEIAEVGTEPKFGRGLVDALLGGGLRTRLRVRERDGTDHLFVVSNVTDVADRIAARLP